MKLHFDSNQEHQADAIKAVTDIYEGQPLSGGEIVRLYDRKGITQ